MAELYPEALEVTQYLPGQQPYSGHLWKPDQEAYRNMRIALQEAEKAKNEGNPPVGAVIVSRINNQMRKFAAHSTEITDDDLDRHAEYNAYHQLQPFVGRDSSTSVAFTTAEPCDSCAHRFIQGGLPQLVIAASYAEAPAFFRPRRLTLDHKLRDSGRSMLVVRGLLKAEALELLTAENKRH